MGKGLFHLTTVALSLEIAYSILCLYTSSFQLLFWFSQKAFDL